MIRASFQKDKGTYPASGVHLCHMHQARTETQRRGGRRAEGLGAGVLIWGVLIWGVRRSAWSCPAGDAAADQGRRPGGRLSCDSLVTVQAWK